MTDRIWRSASQSYIRPLPARLAVRPRGRSRRLERVLADFGCEHSFARAAGSVLEHYGFAIGASAVRDTTLAHARRARARLAEQYAQPFRILAAVAQPQVIAEADGTMICTVQPGGRKYKRPRQWQEMRLVAAQAQDSATTVCVATFGSVAETGRRWGHLTRQAGWGLNSRIHTVGDGDGWIQLQSKEVFREQAHFLCDFFMSVNTWPPPRRCAGPASPSSGGTANRPDSSMGRRRRSSPPSPNTWNRKTHPTRPPRCAKPIAIWTTGARLWTIPEPWRWACRSPRA